MIEFVAGVVVGRVAMIAWAHRPRRRDARVDRRLGEVRALPMTDEQRQAAAARIRSVLEHQRSQRSADPLPPVA